MTLEGFVYKGQGLAKDWIGPDSIHSEFLKVRLSFGSINVYVKGEDHYLFEQAIDPNSVRTAACLRAVPCKVGGYDAFILRTECGGLAPYDLIQPPRTMLEIVAEWHLRTKLGLSDGDKVTIEFDASPPAHYSA
jgi:CTP-dependent riboflavin kinase